MEREEAVHAVERVDCTMSDLTRRRVLALGTAGALLPGCDRLVLPPGEFIDEIAPITPTSEFYRYSYSGPPEVDIETWECAVEDRGEGVARFDLSVLQSYTPVDIEHTLQCIGSGPRLQNIDNAVFGGIPLSELLDDLGVTIDPSIVELGFEGLDGYHDSFPIEDLARPVWVVWTINGESLPPGNGAPCRLLVPGRYGIKNVKWPARLFLTDEPYTGYWQERSWDKDGTYKPNAFVRSPPNLATVVRGEPVTLIGTAYAGQDPVERVEVTVDGGESWQECDFDYAPGPNIWTLWRLDWTPNTRGRVRIRTRVTTASGAQSAEDPGGTDRLAGYDGGMEIELVVT
jgi:DMSO/TMAO reductase YedYZ molybdopterin-dependent catalytic subunit